MIKDLYYKFLLKHEKWVPYIRDKAIETLIKFPVWLIIQLIFRKIGNVFLGGASVFTAVYDVFSHVMPRWVAAILQLTVYYIILNPLLELSIIIITKK